MLFGLLTRKRSLVPARSGLRMSEARLTVPCLWRITSARFTVRVLWPFFTLCISTLGQVRDRQVTVMVEPDGTPVSFRRVNFVLPEEDAKANGSVTTIRCGGTWASLPSQFSSTRLSG